uniref:Reverse transcriptase Ty1/copia-type domain-containing protein n=1 Tax=Tanacetum cinerariifolium TaxID=118510 RepID=A0A6L2M3M7_TANCI|nr:hypothetical protein [Tanacetum cinerariifolium]
MQDELLQFKLLKVWTLVDLPKDKWAIGIDYDEVFTPVARIEAIRLFLDYASFKDFIVYQMDVKSAFLYGKIEEGVYVYQPLSFEDLNFPDKVYKKSDGIFINQEKYVDDILKKFDFTTVKIENTLMGPNKSLIKDAEAEDTSHLHVVKRIFIYLKGQTKLGLLYLRDSPFDLEAYSDSDYARTSLDRKSTTGVSPMIYTSCIKQFWTSAKVITVNDDVQLQALVDGKKVIVNEASIRRGLRLDDAKATACDILTDAQDIPIRTQPSPLNPIGSTNQEGNRGRQPRFLTLSHKLRKEYLHLPMIHYPVTHQVAKIEKLKKRVKKLERKKNKRTYGLTRLYKVGLSARVESSKDEEGMGAQEDASKHGRIAKIDANEDLFLIDETAQDQERIKDQDLFGVHNLDGDEVFMDVTTSKDVERDATVAESVEAAKPKAKGVTIQKPSEFRTTSPLLPSQPPQAKKDKGIMIEPEKPLKRKIKLHLMQRVIIEEWDDVQATIDADRQLDEQIKSQEREQLSIEERSKLLNELLESRRKYFAAKRAEEIKKKPPTKAQQKKNVEEILKKTKAEVTEGSSKRAGQELKQESAKKQKLAEQEQAKVADDDTAELKRCLEIVLEDDDDVAIEVTPLLLNLLP